jgi:hypothetical protein
LSIPNSDLQDFFLNFTCQKTSLLISLSKWIDAFQDMHNTHHVLIGMQPEGFDLNRRGCRDIGFIDTNKGIF